MRSAQKRLQPATDIKATVTSTSSDNVLIYITGTRSDRSPASSIITERKSNCLHSILGHRAEKAPMKENRGDFSRRVSDPELKLSFLSQESWGQSQFTSWNWTGDLACGLMRKPECPRDGHRTGELALHHAGSVSDIIIIVHFFLVLILVISVHLPHIFLPSNTATFNISKTN